MVRKARTSARTTGSTGGVVAALSRMSRVHSLSVSPYRPRRSNIAYSFSVTLVLRPLCAGRSW